MLRGKYNTWWKYYRARLQRFLLRGMIRPLMHWGPMDQPSPGYTIVVACHARFPGMLIASLRLLAKQELINLDRVIVAFDAPRDETLVRAERRMCDEFPQLRISCLYQTPLQSRILRAIGWGWVDCWLSYCKGIAEATTRYVMLHDMDAMLLRPGLVEERYAAIRDRKDLFLGWGWYVGNGVRDSDKLAIIVELMLDAAYLRGRFRPINLFNQVTFYNGVTVDLDTLLYPQTATDRKSILPISELEMVHPGQVISQFTYLVNKPGYIPPEGNNLIFIPYFLFLGGDSAVLTNFTEALSSSEPREVPFFGHRMDMTRLSVIHLKWVIKQTIRLENAVAGGVRPEVRQYLEAIRARCTSGPTASLVPEVEAEIARETELARPDR